MTYGSLSSGAFTYVFDNGSPIPATDLTYSGGSVEVAIGVSAFSGSGTWIGATGSWNTGTNWTDGVNNGVPGDGTRGPGVDTASFSGSGVEGDYADVNPNVAALNFSGANYTLSGGTLTLQHGTGGAGTSAVTVSSGTQTIVSAVEISGGSLAISVSNSGAAGHFRQHHRRQRPGVVDAYRRRHGPVGARRQQQLWRGNHNQPGSLAVNGQLTNSSVAVHGGTLLGGGQVNHNVTMSSGGVAGTLTIGGSLAVTGNSTWYAQDTVSGGGAVQAGTFTLASGAILTTPTLNVAGGAIVGVGTLNGSLNYTSSTGSTFGGLITGGGSTLTMNNALATLTLTGTDTYSGAPRSAPARWWSTAS